MDEQMAGLSPYFSTSYREPRVGDRRVLSGISFVNRNGLSWRDAPREYRPHKTLYLPLEAVERDGRAHSDIGLSLSAEGQVQECYCCCNLSQDPPHGSEPCTKKGILGA